jgi:DNA mismatch endonuclease (patch repair protein)
MTDTVSETKRSEVMRAVRSKDSVMEIHFRKALWKAGYRYKKNARDYFGKPDLALRRHKVVIFLDSCFWHGCEEHCRIPATRRHYWIPKIQRNKQRDIEVNQHYQNNGWHVVRIWEHEMTKSCDDMVTRLIHFLTDRRQVTAKDPPSVKVSPKPSLAGGTDPNC